MILRVMKVIFAVGQLKRDQQGTRGWMDTKASKFVSRKVAREKKLYSHSFTGSTSCTLHNGDKCSLNSWIVARIGNNITSLAFVTEILQVVGSESEFLRQPDLLLLELYDTGTLAEIYKVPVLVKSGKWAVIPYKVSCFS